MNHGAPLVKALSVALNADLSGIALRDEDEIEDRKSETYWPPETRQTQRARADSDRVGGERVFGCEGRMKHYWKNCGGARCKQANDQKIRREKRSQFASTCQARNKC